MKTLEQMNEKERADTMARVLSTQSKLHLEGWEKTILPDPPAPWKKVLDHLDGAAWDNGTGMHVVRSAGRLSDQKRWLHVSASTKFRIPTYAEMVKVQKTFCPADLTAYQLFVPVNKHVNLHPYVLHLWVCLDGDVTPDFTMGLGTI